jgi:hypothetical protein
MPRIKKDGDATPKALRRRSNDPAAQSPTNQVQPSTEAKGPTLVTTMPPSQHAPTLPAHHTPRNAEEEIRRRAYELYEQEGRQHGRDREHWLRAEAEILGRRPGQKSA